MCVHVRGSCSVCKARLWDRIALQRAVVPQAATHGNAGIVQDAGGLVGACDVCACALVCAP